ncbi:uncharacterized protein LOC111225593 [Seriola dumerili]|uniref:uncharacterized protein LOC111225593 n=1 Tax=Seriola dumerili TaxID=41447 RepID=UPI000BBE8DB8|nr:uncharacterized protein LOC111225593 [Seriola dumerili]
MSSPVQTFGFLFIWFSCQVNAVTFHQSPPQIVKDSSEVQINCSHDDTNLVIMLWYQQRKNSPSMTLIGYGYESSPNYEGQFEEQFTLTRQSTVKGSLIIKTANLSHSAVYFCAASLTVVVLQSGDHVFNKGATVTLECSLGPGLSMGSHTMYWYRQNHYRAPIEFLRKEYDTTVGHFQSSINTSKNYFSLQITELFLNDSSTYYCAANGFEAYFGQGTKLTVLGRTITPPTVTVFKPSSKECRNLKDEKERKKTLLCVARDFYPDHVSMFWQVNAKNVTKGVATDPAAWLDNGTYFITSRLRVLAEVWTTPGTNFSCFVSFFNGNKTIETNETVFAVEAGSDGSVKTRVTYLRSTQSFKLSYTVLIIKSSIYGAFVAFLVWKLQGSTGKQKY